jgi:hypothetical protein
LVLSTEQLDTLRGLAGKKAGDLVGWTPIAEAQQLTVLGFAARNRSGWQITASGEAVLELQGAESDSDNVVAMPGRRR